MVIIPNIDSLTLVLAGTVLFYVGVEGDEPRDWEIVAALIGVFMFVVGAGRAFMGAFGI